MIKFNEVDRFKNDLKKLWLDVTDACYGSTGRMDIFSPNKNFVVMQTSIFRFVRILLTPITGGFESHRGGHLLYEHCDLSTIREQSETFEASLQMAEIVLEEKSTQRNN